MAPTTFLIQFDKPEAIFLPGENVIGTVILDLDKVKHCRDLRIAFKGEAYVHWTESSSTTDSMGRDTTETTHYSQRERYFDFQQPLIHRPSDVEGLDLPVGRSEYHFTFTLPTNIPCSFEHSVGHIRYTAKAIVDIPWRFDWCAKAAFTVIAPYDLNLMASQCVPVEDETVKNYSCCCFSKGSIYARISIPGLGYVPGQTVDVNVSFDVKSSSVYVTRVSIKLEQVITFHAESRTKTERITLQNGQSSNELGKSEQIALKLYIPPVPPSNLLHCKIIEMIYQIRVIVHVNGMHHKIDRKYPVLIGTVPLYSQWFNDAAPRPTAPTLLNGDGMAPYTTAVPESPPPNYEASNPPHPIGWTLPPPSYEESLQRVPHIKDSDDSNHVYGADQPFAPRYPVFNLNFMNVPKQ